MEKRDSFICFSTKIDANDDFTYKTGLNNPKSPDDLYFCEKNRAVIVLKQAIKKDKKYVHMRNVTIPDDSSVFIDKFYCDSDNDNDNDIY